MIMCRLPILLALIQPWTETAKTCAEPNADFLMQLHMGTKGGKETFAAVCFEVSSAERLCENCVDGGAQECFLR